jgi:hypothetical protein
MKVKLIDYPAGYQIRVTTWENDGDDYETNIISGLTYEDAKFYQELSNLFTSRNNPKLGGGMGNEDQDAEGLKIALEEVLENHPKISDNLKLEIEDAKSEDDAIYAFFYEFLNDPVQYDYGFCRVAESFKVFYLPDAILIEYDEPDEITKDFV